MADLITRPDSRPSIETESLADRLLDTQSPQRPQSSPRIRIEVDGRVVEGFEGQTILEVCRDNGIEIPTLCYEPSCRASAPAGCAWSRSRARSIRRSPARGRASRR